ncbi:MAG: hypothetical protein NT154_08705, partial [Verrucomicrobia bacterium]|nr:hypothetical protein [Verrucomicrobiota bacterium]
DRANPGELIEFRAMVANLGLGETSPSELVFSVDGAEVGRAPVPALGASATARYTNFWAAAGAGQHLVVAELQLPPGTFDLTSANNSRRATARVSGAPSPAPEVEIGEIDFAALQLVVGESRVIPLRVRNPGFVELRNVPVAFFLDSQQVATRTIDVLAPGAEQELQFDWPVVTRGEHRIAVQLTLPAEVRDRFAVGVKGWQVAVPDTTRLHDAIAKGKWISLGPNVLSDGGVGRICAFAFHPSNPAILYAGGTGGDGGIPAATGVWKTTNGCASWFPVGDKMASLRVSAVAVDPQMPEHVYAATPLLGLWKSSDGGTTWDQFATSQVIGSWVEKLAVRSEAAPASPRVLIYAGTSKGVLRYKSDNPLAKTSTAAEWTVIKTGVVDDLAIHPTNRSILYASMRDQGLFRTKLGVTAQPESPPGNHDWTKVGATLPVTGWRGLVLDIFRGDPSTIYVGIARPKTNFVYALYRSPNEGDTFELLKEYIDGELAHSYNTNGDIYNAFIRVHPVLKDKVYFAGVFLYEWSVYNPPPGKSSWTYVVDSKGVDMKALEFWPWFPWVYFLASDQGMIQGAVSTVAKEHYAGGQPNVGHGTSGDWCAYRNQDLQVTEFYDFDVGTANPPLLVGGTQDTGTVLFSGKPEWQLIRGGDGFCSAFAPSDNTIIYSQEQGLVSTERGQYVSGKLQSTGKIADNKGLPVGKGEGYFVVDPNYPNTVLAACASGTPNKGGEVYVTTDAQLGVNCTWEPRGPFGIAVRGEVSRITIQPQTTHWYAGTSKGQIWCTPQKIRGTWSLIDEHPDQASVISMAFSPKSQDVLYVLYGSGQSYRRIQRFEYQSGSWQGAWITGNLAGKIDDSLGPRVICGDGHRADVAYVGTEHGVFEYDGTRPTVDAWRPYNDGLPLTTVADLQVGPNKWLYGATKDRGAWAVITGPQPAASATRRNGSILGPIAPVSRP